MRPMAVAVVCLSWGIVGCDCGGDLCADVNCAPSDGCHASGACDPDTGECSAPALEDRTLCSLPAGQGWCQAGACEPLAACETSDDCIDDTRCDGARCWPWTSQSPVHDAACVRPIPAGVFSPVLQCEFAAAPGGDPFPEHLDVEATPLVASFTTPAELPAASIVATFAPPGSALYSEVGVIRILRGDDCSQQAVLGGTDLDADAAVDWIVASATPALGDLDGDGEPDVVAFGADGSTLAFTRKLGSWGLLWKAPLPEGASWGACGSNQLCGYVWGGASVHDLDDDGAPEVLRDGAVFRGADGALLSLPPAGWGGASVRAAAVAADVDGDGRAELADGQRLWHASGPPFAWTAEPGYAAGPAPGHVALADLGPYGSGVAPAAPEIVSIRGVEIRASALDGSTVLGPLTLPGLGGSGAPPAVADLDGDGLPEVVGHGGSMIAAVDPDCGPSPRAGGACALGSCDDLGVGATCPAGGTVAWARAFQDRSSSTAGVAAFDLEADGVDEVLSADECFARIHGAGGAVLASLYRSSCTWQESPVAVDVDGDHRAELVVPSNRGCQSVLSCATSLDVEGVDATFPGQRCASAGDCASGLCDAGYCRCTTTAQCCAAADDAACLEAGVKCAAPPAGTPGAGNTCRAPHPRAVAGIRVYADARDHWVGARPIWNQQAYTPTAVSEAGAIPRTSSWAPSWAAAAGNGFRLNVPGSPDGRGAGDASVPPGRFACTAGGALLSASICNRGSEDLAAGVAVEFRAGADLACSTVTAGAIEPAACETVSCTWSAPPAGATRVTVVANPTGARPECWSRNGVGHVAGVTCP